MPDLDQISQKIDYWCQWDEIFKEDADSLRQFFQARRDLFSAIFDHFLAVDPKRSKPTDTWWRQWKDLRANLPDALARSLLLGLVKRDEWYRCLSDQTPQWSYELTGLECRTASDAEGYFAFELFFDAERQLRFARALSPQHRYGTEHVCGPLYLHGRFTTAYNEYTSDMRVYAWNERVKWYSLSVPAGSADTLFHPHAFWVGEPPFQLVHRGLSKALARCNYISLKSADRWYDRLPAWEAIRTHMISQAACWALSEFTDQEVHTTLRDIVLTYARKKSGTFPTAPFPTISVTLPAELRGNGFDNDIIRFSHLALASRYSEQEIFKAQQFTNFTWACGWQHRISQLVEESKNITYQRAASAVWALSQIADDSSIISLDHILTRTLDKRFQKVLRTTLDALAAERGLTREDLADRLVPTHHLTPQAERNRHIASYQVGLSILSNGRLQSSITDEHGKEYKNLPAKVRKEQEQIWREIQMEQKAVVATLSQQKIRLEEAMAAGRKWPYTLWCNLFNTHPILSHLACRLIWNIQAPDGKHLTYALPEHDGNWRAANHQIAQFPQESVLCLAHPVEMAPEEHAAWQRFIVTRRIVQPFKQAFREIYVLTPAEEETGRYSNRFAGHRVTPGPFHGITRGRGWTGSMLHNTEGDGRGWRNFPERNVCAAFLLDSDTVSNDWVMVLAQVSFFPYGTHSDLFNRPTDFALPLSEVHPVVFSETMRDLDLFVAVASIGIDQGWRDQEPERQRQENVFQEQARMRVELLQELLPMLGLANRVRLEEHVALVSGSHADYQVHLGSGSILLLPRGRYLCIVPRMQDERLYLPFEENDAKTSEIFSKILLLAEDEQITDPAILRQISSER